jgi:hypothetical protein
VEIYKDWFKLSIGAPQILNLSLAGSCAKCVKLAVDDVMSERAAMLDV